MPASPTVLPLGWRPVASESRHPLKQLDAAEVGHGVWTQVEIGPRDRSGATRFRAFLFSDQLGRTEQPILHGLYRTASSTSPPLVEVTDYARHLPVTAGGSVEIPEGIELRIVGALGALVPPGGQLVIEYDSSARGSTAAALAASVPPVATPLGAMMFAAGCGVAFRDRGAAAGGRAGRRRLCGFRALDAAHEKRRAREMLEELDAFMRRSKDLDWLIQSQTRPLAEATIATLRARIGVPEGPARPTF